MSSHLFLSSDIQAARRYPYDDSRLQAYPQYSACHYLFAKFEFKLPRTKMALKKDHNSILIFFYIYRRKNRVVILSVYLQNNNLLSKKSSFKFIF